MKHHWPVAALASLPICTWDHASAYNHYFCGLCALRQYHHPPSPAPMKVSLGKPRTKKQYFAIMKKLKLIISKYLIQLGRR